MQTDEDLRSLRCPECGHRDAFILEARENLLVSEDGTLVSDDLGLHWDDTSPCRCCACLHETGLREFRDTGPSSHA
jgi:hypothetical protein